MSDMSKDFMSLGEAATLATNMELLEQVHGGPVPGYMIDYEDMSKDFKSIGELGMMSANIDMVEAMRGGYRPESVRRAAAARDKATVIFCAIFFGIIAIAHFFPGLF